MHSQHVQSRTTADIQSLRPGQPQQTTLPTKPPVPQNEASIPAPEAAWSFANVRVFASGEGSEAPPPNPSANSGSSSQTVLRAPAPEVPLSNSRSYVPVSGSAHPSERAADRLAAHVTGTSAPSSPIVAQPGHASGAMANYLWSLHGGDALNADVRASLEPKFGQSLENVRLHTDAPAERAARALGAKAFAYGTHIGFSAGRYDPFSSDGRSLLAHEIAHTLHPQPIVARQVDSGATATAVALTPDEDSGPEIIPPAASGAGRLREEAEGHLRDSLQQGNGDENTRSAALRGASYIIVGSRISWYRSDGTLIRAFHLRADARTWAPGMYLRTPDDEIRPWVSMNGEEGFAPRSWVWADRNVGLIINWIPPEELPAFHQIVDGLGDAAVMVVIPRDVSATRRDTRQAQRLVEQVQQRMAARAATSAGATSSTAGDSSTSSTSTPQSAPQPTPQQRIGDPPDRISVSSTETNVSVNITVDQARTSVTVEDGETVDSLEESIQTAADDLRRSRDPAQSMSVAGGATTTAFAQDDGGPHPRMAERIGNAPRYPSSITNYGPQVTVPGATNRFSMELDFSSAGSDLLSQVTARMQTIQYYWELLDVTGLNPDDREDAGNRTVGAGDRATNWEQFKHDQSQNASNIEEDTARDIENLDNVPLPVKSDYLALIGISNVIRYVGGPISSFIATVTKELNEQRLSFDRPGDFLVRCVATPAHDEDSTVIRASSVATYLERVEPIHARAASVADSLDQQIAALEAQLRDATTDAQRMQLTQRLDALRRSQTATTAELGGDALRLTNERLAVALALQSAIAAGTRREARTPETRLLAVQLELQHIDLDRYVYSLQEQQHQLQERLALISQVGLRMPAGSYHPHVVLVSEENGNTYDLVTTLGEAADSTEGNRHYLLADVTSPKPHDRYVYEGRSTQAGVNGHSEAIRQAFVDFRENNGYGRGTIAIRLPSTLATAIGGPPQVEPEMRSAPGAHARAMQRLSDLATAAEVAALFVTGPAGVAIGVVGGLAGAVVAIDRLQRRREGVDFRWASFETIMDISTIVAGTVGLAGVGVLPLRNLPGWANRVERIQGTLHIFGVTQLGSQIIVIPVQLELQLQEIEGMTGISDGERAARRAEAFLQAVRSGIVTTMTAAQMARGQAEEPAASREQPGNTPVVDENGDVPGRPAGAPERAAGAADTVGPNATSPRAAALENELGDLQGRVSVREGTVQDRSVRVRYRNGELVMEVGAQAGPAQVRAHLETARVLMRYQGPLGRLRQLLSRALQAITGRPGYGSQGFESQLEVRKLNQILDTLHNLESAAQQRIERMGTRENPFSAAELDQIQRDIAEIEFQLRYHESLVNSLEAGSGHVAAELAALKSVFPALEMDLTAIDAGLEAVSTPGQRSLVERMTVLEQGGRVTGMADWIQETALQAGNRARLRARMAELASALQQAEALPADQRLRLEPSTAPSGARSFGTIAETSSTSARVRSAPENRLRALFSGDDLVAFDTVMDRMHRQIVNDPTQAAVQQTRFETAVGRLGEPAIRQRVQAEREAMTLRGRQMRNASALVDPLNPQLGVNLAPGDPNGSATVWIHYERTADRSRVSPVELAQAERLAAASGEEVHFFATDPQGQQYPGIDGTIGNPRRPMQLKGADATKVNSNRFQAQEALQKAVNAGISHVEVYIEDLARTPAQVEAEWPRDMVDTQGNSRRPGSVFDGDVIASITVSCAGGDRIQITQTGPITFIFTPVP